METISRSSSELAIGYFQKQNDVGVHTDDGGIQLCREVMLPRSRSVPDIEIRKDASIFRNCCFLDASRPILSHGLLVLCGLTCPSELVQTSYSREMREEKDEMRKSWPTYPAGVIEDNLALFDHDVRYYSGRKGSDKISEILTCAPINVKALRELGCEKFVKQRFPTITSSWYDDCIALHGDSPEVAKAKSMLENILKDFFKVDLEVPKRFHDLLKNKGVEENLRDKINTKIPDVYLAVKKSSIHIVSKDKTAIKKAETFIREFYKETVIEVTPTEKQGLQAKPGMWDELMMELESRHESLFNIYRASKDSSITVVSEEQINRRISDEIKRFLMQFRPEKVQKEDKMKVVGRSKNKAQTDADDLKVSDVGRGEPAPRKILNGGPGIEIMKPPPSQKTRGQMCDAIPYSAKALEI